MRDLPWSLTLSYLWPSDSQLSSVLAPYTRRTNSSSDLWNLTGLWSSLIISSLPIGAHVSYRQCICCCASRRRQSVLSPFFITRKSSRHLTVAKGFSSIDQCKSKGLILFLRKRIQLNYRLIIFIDLHIHINQVCKKLCATIHVFVNGASSLHLETIKLTLQLQPRFDTFRQILLL